MTNAPRPTRIKKYSVFYVVEQQDIETKEWKRVGDKGFTKRSEAMDFARKIFNLY